MPPKRKPLTSVLGTSAGPLDAALSEFDSATPADEFGPLPKGSYVCLVVRGGLITAATGTPGYGVEFKVVEGTYSGRRVWRTWFLTPAAMTYTKRDLAKFGLDSKDKLTARFPADRMVFKVTVTVRTGDDGTQRNEVKQVELLRVQEPEVDPFAPAEPVLDGGVQ
jgi:hypothetical protein